MERSYACASRRLEGLPSAASSNKTPSSSSSAKETDRHTHFADLAKPGSGHPSDPDSSGGAQWSISPLRFGVEIRSRDGRRGQARALGLLKSVGPLLSTPDSARAARTHSRQGTATRLTYELEGLMMKEAGADIEIVVPRATIFSEHPAAIMTERHD